ncbi:hypothetical protein NDU88_000127 [Pleurodeles waltl]|uniref:Uncharacterized protein n=1 Tax=Pleurodeles waltl TaxID=8319 RepID=A0AAV7SVK5_PLEWA|nr:hypothetical protein NDU88_000127 [Pleurodeles waltl]
MATAGQLRALREEATCSICLGFFQDPVALDCGHNFCRPCITLSWRGAQQDRPCPECRAVAPGGLLRPNRQLGNIVEKLRQLQEPDSHLCPRHGERLLMFCTTDRTPICVVCDRCREHRGHAVVILEEAAEAHKNALQPILANLKNALVTLQEWKTEKEETSATLEYMFKSQQIKILCPFEDLKEFLENEKQSLSSRLEREHKETLKKIQGKVTVLEKQQDSFTKLLTEIEEQSLLPDIEFMKVVQKSIDRLKHLTLLKPEDDSAECVHIVKRCRSQHSYLMERVKEIKETFLDELEFYEHIKCFEYPDTAKRNFHSGMELVIFENAT